MVSLASKAAPNSALSVSGHPSRQVAGALGQTTSIRLPRGYSSSDRLRPVEADKGVHPQQLDVRHRPQKQGVAVNVELGMHQGAPRNLWADW
jgi:hypothetical protein